MGRPYGRKTRVKAKNPVRRLQGHYNMACLINYTSECIKRSDGIYSQKDRSRPNNDSSFMLRKIFRFCLVVFMDLKKGNTLISWHHTQIQVLDYHPCSQYLCFSLCVNLVFTYLSSSFTKKQLTIETVLISHTFKIRATALQSSKLKRSQGAASSNGFSTKSTRQEFCFFLGCSKLEGMSRLSPTMRKSQINYKV